MMSDKIKSWAVLGLIALLVIVVLRGLFGSWAALGMMLLALVGAAVFVFACLILVALTLTLWNDGSRVLSALSGAGFLALGILGTVLLGVPWWVFFVALAVCFAVWLLVVVLTWALEKVIG